MAVAFIVLKIGLIHLVLVGLTAGRPSHESTKLSCNQMLNHSAVYSHKRAFAIAHEGPTRDTMNGTTWCYLQHARANTMVCRHGTQLCQNHLTCVDLKLNQTIMREVHPLQKYIYTLLKLFTKLDTNSELWQVATNSK